MSFKKFTVIYPRASMYPQEMTLDTFKCQSISHTGKSSGLLRLGGHGSSAMTEAYQNMSWDTLPKWGSPTKIGDFFIDILQNDQYSHDSIRPKPMKLSISMKVTIAISTAFKSVNGHYGVGK